nr:MAG TPA: hypothetical protein [Caudoviricetes sp.]
MQNGIIRACPQLAVRRYHSAALTANSKPYRGRWFTICHRPVFD